MTDAEFLAILHATQDYSKLTIAEAIAILSGHGNLYYRLLLSSEISAAWNGDDDNPLPSGEMGDAIYHNPGSSLDGWTVDQINHLAFMTDPSDASWDLNVALAYLGANGESDTPITCKVVSPTC